MWKIIRKNYCIFKMPYTAVPSFQLIRNILAVTNCIALRIYIPPLEDKIKKKNKLYVLPDAVIAQSRFDDKFALNVNFFPSAWMLQTRSESKFLVINYMNFWLLFEELKFSWWFGYTLVNFPITFLMENRVTYPVNVNFPIIILMKQFIPPERIEFQ